MKLKILSPDKIFFDAEIVSIILPGTLGKFEILHDHAPMISSLTKGEITVNTDSQKKNFEIKGGFVEVLNNEISVLVD